jgi:hypothetical protein
MTKTEQPAQRDDRQYLAAQVREAFQCGRRQRHAHHLRNADDLLHRHHVGGEDLVAGDEDDKLLCALLCDGGALLAVARIGARLLRLGVGDAFVEIALIDALRILVFFRDLLGHCGAPYPAA